MFDGNSDLEVQHTARSRISTPQDPTLQSPNKQNLKKILSVRERYQNMRKAGHANSFRSQSSPHIPKVQGLSGQRQATLQSQESTERYLKQMQWNIY